jgi:hypothetical protein
VLSEFDVPNIFATVISYLCTIGVAVPGTW